MKKILVVGAGFAGSTVARVLADAGYLVDIIDTRSHIGGNAYDYTNENGIRVHAYGPHIFHTSNKEVVDFLSQFTTWIEYKHIAKAQLPDGSLVPFPVNKDTVEIVGKENIVETFFRPYTEKMWGMKLEEISPTVLSRVPVKEDSNEFYFPNDEYQFMPENGYTELFKNMLDHPNIKLSLCVAFEKSMEKDYFHIFNSMPIDAYFEFKNGELPYRSLKFTHMDVPVNKLFPAATVNFTHTYKYTRVTEWKNFPGHGENDHITSLTFEEPCDYRDNEYQRYYPVKDISGKNREIYESYKKIVPNNMTFIGRCGLYVYIDIHQAVNSSLKTVYDFVKRNNQ